MKKIIIVLLATLVLLTGCSSDALADYKKAIKKTGDIEKGNMNISSKVSLDFVKEGLSEDKIKTLNYFDEIEFAINTQYDFSDENKKVIAKSYYNIGGIGVDSIFYMDDLKMYIKLPIIKGYISLDDIETIGVKNNSFEEEGFMDFFDPIVDKWNEMLKQEDVFKGKKTYILTEEGQIKTTTYTIDASQEQLKALGDELVKLIKNENILEMFLKNSSFDNEIDKETIISKIEDHFSRLVLEGFNGNAYVDFDGRMIKQEFNIKLGLHDAKKGEPKFLEASFTMEYFNLGEEQIFDFPVIEENEWIDINKKDDQFIFPEYIFN